jgi:hypothetical protein
VLYSFGINLDSVIDPVIDPGIDPVNKENIKGVSFDFSVLSISFLLASTLDFMTWLNKDACALDNEAVSLLMDFLY